jgi:hypothetical protein
MTDVAGLENLVVLLVLEIEKVSLLSINPNVRLLSRSGFCDASA